MSVRKAEVEEKGLVSSGTVVDESHCSSRQLVRQLREVRRLLGDFVSVVEWTMDVAVVALHFTSALVS